MPTKFADIGKGPKDILGDDYPSAVTLKAKTKAGPVGVTIETEKGSSGLKPKLSTKFSYAGFSVDKGQLKADGSYALETSVKLNPATKMSFKFTKGTPDLYIDFSQGSIYATGVVTDITKFASVASTACFTSPTGFKVGASAAYTLGDKSGFKSYDFGTSYGSGPFFASVTTSSKLTKLNLGLSYAISKELSIASETTHSKETPATLSAIGGLYKAPFGNIKAKMGCDGVLYASFVKELVPKVKVTAAGSVNTSNVSDIKTGLGIEI